VLSIESKRTGTRMESGGAMAVLSRRERRILLRIERQLTAEDPGLARELRFRAAVRSGLGPMLRLAAGVVGLVAAVNFLLGASPAFLTLITFSVVLVIMSYWLAR